MGPAIDRTRAEARSANEERGLLAAAMAEVAMPARQPWLPLGPAARITGRLAARPRRTAGRLAAHGVELARILAGVSEVDPARDRRFRDPTWKGNPGYRRLAQSYLAFCALADDLIAAGELDWRSERRLRLLAHNVLDALAPTNHPALNPEVAKAALDSGGATLRRGAANLAVDVLRPGLSLRLPSMVDPDAFTLGDTVAATPGAVVARTEMFELLQYAPMTERVRERPLLVVPSTINKYYVFDLAPGRSAIEHAVRGGQQVFAISWRDPGREHAGWDLESYAGAVVDALAIVHELTTADRAHLVGLCAGGAIAAVTAAHLAAVGEERIASFTTVVSVLDHERVGDVGALVDEGSAEMAVAESSRRGYVDGQALAGVFAWLRPEDRVWRYWVQSYLLGRNPSAHDILYWNADTANLSAGFHRDLLELAVANDLAKPGALVKLGTPIDLGRIGVDAYLVAGLNDHLTPWESCLRSARRLGGDCRFVLTNTGHVSTVVSPPGHERAAFWAAPAHAEEPDAWVAAAPLHRGSWWDEWLAWLDERGGDRKRARRSLGGNGHPPLGPAPGRYVLGHAGS